MDLMDEQRTYKLYSVRDLIELQDNPNQWIVKNMIPTAGRVLAYGAGGAFKSCLMFDLCVAVASGGRLLENIPLEQYGPTVVLSTEGTIWTTRKRLLSHMRTRNAVPDGVQLHYGRQPLFIDIKEERDCLRKIVETVRPMIILLDPYVNFFSGDENSTKEVKQFTLQLNEIIEGYNCTVILIHHANKVGDIRGSTVIQGWADTVLKFSVARNTTVPGIKEPQKVLTVKGEKQRDGADGDLFSAVPFIDEKLGMTTFGIFAGMDSKMVAAAHLKQCVLKYLREYSEIDFTRSQLATTFCVGKDRMDIVIDWLLRDQLIVESAALRDCGSGRKRAVECYKANALTTRIDATRVMLEAEKQIEDLEADGYD
jgi:hypothetical protein